MSQRLLTTNPAPAPDDLDPNIDVGAFDILDRVWRFFTSKLTGLGLIFAMGLLSLAGTLLAQAPDGMRSDPQAYASWLESVRPKYGGWTTLLNMAGMFEVFSSIWFKSVSVLLAVSILACSINRAPLLWKRAQQPRTHMADSFYTHAALTATVDLPVPAAKAFEEAGKALRAHRFRTIVDPAVADRNLYADRFRFGPFGTVLAHVSFVLILLGVLISASTGFKNTQFAATVGSKVDVGHGTGLTVEAKSFADSYYPDGLPRDYASELVLYRDGKQVASQTVRVNDPMRWGGVSFYQSFYGVSAAMLIKDSSGKTVFDSGVPLVWNSDDGKHVIGQLPLPDQGLSVYVVSPASGEVDSTIGAGQVQLEVYRNGTDQPIATQVVSQGAPAKIADLDITFVRERQFTGLIVSRDPGAIWVWIGSTLMVVGLFAVFFFPHRRVWVRVRSTSDGSRIQFASPMRHDSAFASRFNTLVADVTLAAKSGGHQSKVGPENA